MDEGRNADKPRRRWSHPSPRNRNNPRPAVSRRNDPSANALKNHHSYLALAREATSRGDAIAAENFYQHAEHFLRLLKDPTS
jgi:hypothetical protein